MGWSLLLAHFIADFPAQPDWMAQNKHRPGVLPLHIAVHFVVMLILMGSSWQWALPGIAVVALAHFGIDYAKLELGRRKPQWINLPYLIDQGLHFLSIAWVASWMSQSVQEKSLLKPETAIYATGYLVATYVWFITERVMVHAHPEYRKELAPQVLPRMLVRGLLLTLFLAVSFRLLAPTSIALAGTVMPLPYLTGKNSMRMLATDLLVALTAACLIRLAL